MTMAQENTQSSKMLRQVLMLSVIPGLESVAQGELQEKLSRSLHGLTETPTHAGKARCPLLVDIRVHTPFAMKIMSKGRVFVEFLFRCEAGSGALEMAHVPEEIIETLFLRCWCVERIFVMVPLKWMPMRDTMEGDHGDSDSNEVRQKREAERLVALGESVMMTLDQWICTDDKKTEEGMERTKEDDKAYISQIIGSSLAEKRQELLAALSLWQQLRNFHVHIMQDAKERERHENDIDEDQAAPSDDVTHGGDNANKKVLPIPQNSSVIINDLDKLCFRITGKRAGLHRFTSMELATWTAEAMEPSFPTWEANLSNYHIEILCYMHLARLLFAFTVMDHPTSLERLKSYRFSLTSLTLKPSIAYCMYRISEVETMATLISKKENSDRMPTVVDICCGSGTIPIISSMHFKGAKYIAGDRSQFVIQIARRNGQETGQDGIVFQKWDFTNLPLEDKSVDIVISNLPFGKQCSSESTNSRIYPRLIRELHRVLCVGGRAILLTTEKGFINRALSDPNVNQFRMLVIDRRFGPINQGGLQPVIFVLRKTDRKQKKQAKMERKEGKRMNETKEDNTDER